jgi:hypothetical protein
VKASKLNICIRNSKLGIEGRKRQTALNGRSGCCVWVRLDITIISPYSASNSQNAGRFLCTKAYDEMFENSLFFASLAQGLPSGGQDRYYRWIGGSIWETRQVLRYGLDLGPGTCGGKVIVDSLGVPKEYKLDHVSPRGIPMKVFSFIQ